MIFVKNTTLLFRTKIKVVQCALQRIAMGGLALENQLSVWNVPNTTLPYQNENCAVHLNGRSCISLRESVGRSRVGGNGNRDPFTAAALALSTIC